MSLLFGLLLACLVMVDGAEPARAGVVGDVEGAFQQANLLYERGDYEAAAVGYRELLSDGRGSAALHFNLGNALFKSGQIGRAIYHYRVARQLKPRDADIRANLRFARNQLQDRRPESRVQRWLGSLTLNEWALLAMTVFWLWLGMIVLGQLKPVWRRSLRVWVRLLGFAVAVLGVALGWVVHDRVVERSAIVVTMEAAVRFGPFTESQAHFEVRDGVELAVLDARDDWIEVEDPVQGRGWIERSQVVLFPK